MDMLAELDKPADETEARLARTQQYISQQDVVKNLASAKLAHRLLDEIIAGLAPGMRESEGKALALDCFARHGIERTWHPPYIRFGGHTLLTFMDKAAEDRVLQEEDIAFVDIGIVLEGIEGDAGKTAVFGDNAAHHALQKGSEAIFHAARDFWKRANPTGVALYEFIQAQARAGGWEFCLDPAGHLIGEFPHKGWKKGINHFPGAIEAGKWILEIQIRHPELPCAAFYENLLY